MKRVLILLTLTSAHAHAGVAAYDGCIGPAFESRVMTVYKNRFPGDDCDSPATCDPGFIESAEAITRSNCR